jgi:hypothetical protein
MRNNSDQEATRSTVSHKLTYKDTLSLERNITISYSPKGKEPFLDNLETPNNNRKQTEKFSDFDMIKFPISTPMSSSSKLSQGFFHSGEYFFPQNEIKDYQKEQTEVRQHFLSHSRRSLLFTAKENLEIEVYNISN